MTYSAICLDLDDTLWPIAPAILQAERATADYVASNHPEVAAGLTSPEEIIATMCRWREQVALSYPERAFDLTWLRMEAMRRQALSTGCHGAAAEDFARRAFEIFFHWRHQVEPYPEVPDALASLARNFPLYVLSNGNAEIARTSLGGYFRSCFSARGLGVAKPDPRAFLAVAQSVGIPANRWLYVGDDPRADILGARAAGMATAWVHRGLKHWPEDLVRADIEVSNLDGLVECLLYGTPSASAGAAPA